MGLLAGLSGVFFALIGAYVTMNGRFIVEDWLTLSQVALLGFGLTGGTVAALTGPAASEPVSLLLRSILAGLVFGVVMAAFLLLIRSVDLRTYLVASNPALVRALSFAGAGSPLAAGMLILAGAVTGLVGGLIALPGARLRKAILCGLFGAFVDTLKLAEPLVIRGLRKENVRILAELKRYVETRQSS